MDPIRSALFGFWSGFGVPAFNDALVILVDEQGNIRSPTVEDMPYITFNTVSPPALSSTLTVANVYDYSNSFLTLDTIKKRISDAIPEVTGKKIKVGSGFIRLFRGTPFMQDMREEDVNIRRAYINIELRNLSIWE